MDFKCKPITSSGVQSEGESVYRLEEKLTALDLWKKDMVVSNLEYS